MGIGVKAADETASAGAETVGIQTVGIRAGVETRSSTRRLGVQLDRRRP